MGRLLSHSQVFNGHTEQLVAQCYDALGRLIHKRYANKKVAESLTYNIRGWLTSSNDPATHSNALFGFKMAYLNNGNISAMEYKHRAGALERYDFSYDALNRITSGIHDKGRYSLSKVGYDLNGNILDLERWGALDQEALTFGQMDLLSYRYKGNQLLEVSEAGSLSTGFVSRQAPGTHFRYDANGNMTSDVNKGILNIDYNHLNLPTAIDMEQGNIDYIYVASGQKMSKSVFENGKNEVLTSYSNMALYKDQALEFFFSPFGYIEPNEAGYDYVYYLKDHLGSVRSSFKYNQVLDSVEVIESKDYYPFGLEHKTNNNVVNGTENNYQTFQEQELNEELGYNMLEFKYRHYDPAIARFVVVDPLTEDYMDWGPYVFSGNRVIDARELEGLEPYVVTGRSFIPDKSLSNPKPFSKIKSFAGDNRSDYQLNTTAYRTEQKVRIDFDGNKATTLSNRANSTIGYDGNGKVVDTSDPGKAGPTPTYTMGDGTATVNMEVDASNKLVSGAPAINYDVGVTITQNEDGSFSFELKGESDGFPGYEFFITNEKDGKSYQIYGSNPNKTGDGPWSLFPPMEKDINVSGNSSTTSPVEEEKKK